MDNYQTLLSQKMIEVYSRALVIDLTADKIYKYSNENGTFVLKEESSYIDYYNNCSSIIYEDDLQNYLEALSVSKLEENNNKTTVNYKMISDKLQSYMDYTSYVSLHNDNGKKIIVVLIAHNNTNNNQVKPNTTKSNLEQKLGTMIDAVSMAMLKIHKIVTIDSTKSTKDEYIDSILAELTTEFPEFNKSFSENAGEVYSNGKSTILIIDDDKLSCSIIGKNFDKDYFVITANNGQEAINILKESKDKDVNISCIFLDLIMPVLDGFSVLDYLQQNHYFAKLPVIIISGNYDKETRNRAYSYPIADMLEKPFNAQVIRHRVENLIGLYRSSGILNDLMLEQHEDLKDTITSIVTAYEVDNSKNMEAIKQYMKILASQVLTQYPEYNLKANMIDKLAASATYYSIGNYTLPKTLLYKKEAFTEPEKQLIKKASINGATIVEHIIFNKNTEIDNQYCYEITKYYTERYDGKGYPEGMTGENIPISAQIASLVIEYINLLNTIVPIDYNKIASLIVMESGSKFNPKVVEAFKNVKDKFEAVTK